MNNSSVRNVKLISLWFLNTEPIVDILNGNLGKVFNCDFPGLNLGYPS